MSNIQPYIIINGVNSRTISGLLITSLPPISKPQQRTQVETVDGRSGDIITPLGFSAYDKTVSIGLTYNYDIDEVIEFFNTSGTVIFSNEPTKYYRFAIYEQIDFDKLIKFKTAEVVLHVQPYKFSTTEEPLLFNDPTEISVENNGNTDARPNLLITGSGEIDVSLNGSQLLSMDFDEDNQTIIIDSENMNAYGAQSAIREVVADIEPKQAGSGDPSPDNIREISGYSELNLTRCGKNFWNVGIQEEYIYNGRYYPSQNYWCTETNITVLPNTTYTLQGASASDGQICFYDKDNVYIPNSAISARVGTFTTPSNAYFISVYNSISTLNEPKQLELGNQSTEYEAYNGSIYNIAFTDGDDPLTVYGGRLNVTTGELTNTLGLITQADCTSITSWTNAGGLHIIRIYKNTIANGNGLSNMLPQKTFNEGWTSTTECFTLEEHNDEIRIYTTSTTLEDFLSRFADLQLVYPLGEPITYQLTPTQINNLLGLNNLYSDTGDLSVKYKSGGVIQTQTGDIVTFTVGVGDMDKGTLLNRLITGNYDKIRLKKGENVISFTGNVKQVSIDKYSRWI